MNAIEEYIIDKTIKKYNSEKAHYLRYRILNIVCEVFKINVEAIKGNNRERILSSARHIYCHLAYKYLHAEYEDKKLFDFITENINKDRCLVNYSKKVVPERIKFDKIKIENRTFIEYFEEADLKILNLLLE